MDGFASLRAQVLKFLILFLWAHVPVVAVVGLLVGAPWIMATGGAAALAASATACWLSVGAAPSTRYVVAVALMAMPALIVFELSGHPWQIDAHMYFFAALAILTALCDWRTILVATVTVATHHLVLNFAMPAAVFPEGSFGRVLVHAGVVAVEAAVLLWLAFRLNATLSESERAVAEAERAREEAESADGRRREAERRAERERKEALAEIADRFEREVGQIIASVTKGAQELDSSAASMSSMSETVHEEAGRASGATQGASDNVQTVASSAEEMEASVSEIADRTSDTMRVVREASEEASAAEKRIEGLDRAARDIGGVVDQIKDVAARTNMLALNATIEAARAGEAGQGFAVVAREVKSLAEQTATAADDVTKQVESIRKETSDAVSSIGRIGERVSSLEQVAGSVSSAVEQQNAATGEIARSAQEAADGTRQAASGVEAVQEAAEKADGVAGEVAGTASELSSRAAELRTEIDRFLKEVRG